MRICHLAITACLTLLSLPAFADTTYTYTGNDFTGAGTPYTFSDSVTGWFTVASPLGNIPILSRVDFISFSFTDGVQTITNLNYDETTSAIAVGTDSSGDITSWNIVAVPITNSAFDLVETRNLTVNNFLVVGDEGEFNLNIPGGGEGTNLSDPGTWTSSSSDPSPSTTPEPSTFALLGTGLLGLAGIARRRFA